MSTDDAFSCAVHDYIAEDEARVAELAERFETMLSAVRRWADGRNRPHPFIQKQVLRYIEERT